MTYGHQLMIARKFVIAFSAQLMPTFIHRNFSGHKLKKMIYLTIGA